MADDETPFSEEAQDIESNSNGISETPLTTETASTKLLADATRIYIRRPKNPDRMMISYDVTKKFEILDQNGDPMYYVVQEDSCCSRSFCCSNKWFTADIYDLDEVHVGQLEKGVGCLTCWFGCCPQQLTINWPPMRRLGTVEQRWSIVGSPDYRTVSHKRDLVFVMNGTNMCGVKKIKLYSGTKERLGKMKDEWDGLPTDAFASQTCFGIALNEDKKLDLEHKFLLLGSAFLMAYSYFDADKKVTHQELIGLKKS